MPPVTPVSSIPPVYLPPTPQQVAQAQATNPQLATTAGPTQAQALALTANAQTQQALNAPVQQPSIEQVQQTIAQRTATTADDAVADLLRRTRHFFILTAAVAGAKLFLDLPERAHNIARVLGTIALILQIAIWGNGLITFWFRNYAEHKAASDTSSRTTIAMRAL